MKTRTGFVSNSSSSSFVIVGVPIDRSKLYKEVEERSCKCPVEGVPKFCPKCGKAFMVTNEYPIPEFEDEDMIAGKVSMDDDGNTTYAGIIYEHWSNESSRIRSIGIPSPEDKEELRKILEPIGLWNEKQYGIYFGTTYG